jgi:hypothetical protein
MRWIDVLKSHRISIMNMGSSSTRPLAEQPHLFWKRAYGTSAPFPTRQARGIMNDIREISLHYKSIQIPRIKAIKIKLTCLEVVEDYEWLKPEGADMILDSAGNLLEIGK